jgi:1-phosphofructokinase
MDRDPTVFVFAPDPLLTITVEQGHGGRDEIHLHAGGQGFWIARMAAALGADVTIGSPFGGEAGQVARRLMEASGIRLAAVEIGAPAGAYIHDRRGGERVEVATMDPQPLSRHDIDDLYGGSLVPALNSEVTVLAGPGPWDPPALPAEIYTRLAADLQRNGRVVVADLSGDPLAAALAGGLSVLKVSHEELLRDGRARSERVADLVAAMHDLRAAGAADVVVTRAAEPALALVGDDVLEVGGPTMNAVDHRGAGDSLTAGIAAGLARGLGLPRSVRLGAAAGALNVTRHGLATGDRKDIEELARQFETRALDVGTLDGDTASTATGRKGSAA